MKSAQIIQFPKRYARSAVKVRFAQDILALAAVANWEPGNKRYHLSNIMIEHDLTSPKATAKALEALGWNKNRSRTSKGKQRLLRTWWAPPGAPKFYKRGLGRPSYRTYLTEHYIDTR